MKNVGRIILSSIKRGWWIEIYVMLQNEIFAQKTPQVDFNCFFLFTRK